MSIDSLLADGGVRLVTFRMIHIGGHNMWPPRSNGASGGTLKRFMSTPPYLRKALRLRRSVLPPGWGEELLYLVHTDLEKMVTRKMKKAETDFGLADVERVEACMGGSTGEDVVNSGLSRGHLQGGARNA